MCNADATRHTGCPPGDQRYIDSLETLRLRSVTAIAASRIAERDRDRASDVGHGGTDDDG